MAAKLDLGKSVLGALPRGENVHDNFPEAETGEMSQDMAFDTSGGSMGALISETPELGESAYQMHITDGKAPIKR